MTKTKIFLGNIPWSVNTVQLGLLLAEWGYKFHSAKVVMDQDTQRSKGFAFIEFPSVEEAEKALRGLEGVVLDGRRLNASEAHDRPRTDNSQAKRGKGETDVW